MIFFSLIFGINLSILSGFPLTFFHLAEALLSAFSWLYTFIDVVVQKYRKMSFIYNYSQFWWVLILQSAYFICTTLKRKRTMEQ